MTIVKCDAHCLHNESGLCGIGEIELSMDWSVICETLDLKPLEEVLEWESVRDEEAAKRMRARILEFLEIFRRSEPVEVGYY
jgi:hypothetical protein